MKRLVHLSTALSVGVAGMTFAQGDPSYAHSAATVPTIKAYELSAAEEASFNVADHQPSPFWSAWDAAAGASLDRAAINGVEHYTWGEPAENADEGKVELRFAYGAAGIYFLVTVTDDSWSSYWCGWPPGDNGDNSFEIFGCQVSALDLYNNPAAYLPCLNDAATAHQMNSIYFQIQSPFCDVADPFPAFSLNKWNPAAADTGDSACRHSNVLYDRDMTFDEAAALGIKVDILDQTSATVKCQEWLFPWAQWGSTNPPGITQKARGDRLGMCFGYNDMDLLTQANSTAMRWRKCDPYSSTSWNTPLSFTGPPPPNPTALDAWGDIVFDVPLDDSCAECPPLALKRNMAARMPRADGQSHFLTFAGRSIKSSSALPRNSVVLRRVSFQDGSVRMDRLPVGEVR